jgi:hypothetical protein
MARMIYQFVLLWLGQARWGFSQIHKTGNSTGNQLALLGHSLLLIFRDDKKDNGTGNSTYRLCY